MKAEKKRNFVNLNINPCKQCMPMGAALALKGIEGTMMLLHGSQGCSTYIRRHMAAHYNEPVDIASSSLSEHGTVYGGSDNMKKALKNMIKSYNPEIIGVATTCLAETIGEDIRRIISEFEEENKEFIDVVKLKKIIPIQTPGYGGTQYEGYYRTIKSLVADIAEGGEKEEFINVIAPLATPADIREIKRIVKLFGIDAVVIPDISETLDAPFNKQYKKIPDGGTPIAGIIKMGKAKATIEMGELIEDSESTGVYLAEKFGIPLYKLPVPIGLANTDAFTGVLIEITESPMPYELVKERGRMIDGMIDSHKHNAEGKAALFGDPELTYSTAIMCIENGIMPELISTGSLAAKMKSKLEKWTAELEVKPIIIDDTDFETIRCYAKKQKTNILIGNSGGKFISEKDGIPLVRIGFPVHDRVGAQRALYVGYEGSMRFIDSITNTLLDSKYTTYRSRMYKAHYKKESETV